MAVSLLVRIDHETYVAAISLGEEMLGEWNSSLIGELSQQPLLYSEYESEATIRNRYLHHATSSGVPISISETFLKCVSQLSEKLFRAPMGILNSKMGSWSLVSSLAIITVYCYYFKSYNRRRENKIIVERILKYARFIHSFSCLSQLGT
jgi:hypothetical protein